jgi:hypothetical protein
MLKRGEMQHALFSELIAAEEETLEIAGAQAEKTVDLKK